MTYPNRRSLFPFLPLVTWAALVVLSEQAVVSIRRISKLIYAFHGTLP